MADPLARFIVRPVAGAGRFGAFQVWDTLHLCQVGELHDFQGDAAEAARAATGRIDEDADDDFAAWAAEFT